MKMQTLATLVMPSGVSASAQAPPFYATRDTNLYRFGLDGTVDTFELRDRIVGITQTDGASKLYNMIDAKGTPSDHPVPDDCPPAWSGWPGRGTAPPLSPSLGTLTVPGPQRRGFFVPAGQVRG